MHSFEIRGGVWIFGARGTRRHLQNLTRTGTGCVTANPPGSGRPDRVSKQKRRWPDACSIATGDGSHTVRHYDRQVCSLANATPRRFGEKTGIASKASARMCGSAPSRNGNHGMVHEAHFEPSQPRPLVLPAIRLPGFPVFSNAQCQIPGCGLSTLAVVRRATQACRNSRDLLRTCHMTTKHPCNRMPRRLARA